MSAPVADVALVVPVYNERERAPDFADALLSFIAQQPFGSELIFVDDGSTDGTADFLEGALRARSGVSARVLRRPHLGKGAAITAGIAASGSGLTAFCDIDLSTPLPDLDRIIRAASRADILAIGSRDVSGSVLTHSQGPVRKTLGRMYNRLLQATITPGVVDTQCGAKAARTAVWRGLLRHCSQLGFAWDAEVVAVALGLGIDVREVPISWHHDARSQVHVLRDGLAMVRETPRLMRSAAAARAARPVALSSVRPPGACSEVFDDANAARMQAVDRTHWWFRSKAALVATALRATAPEVAPTGWLVDIGGGSGGVTSLLGWPSDRMAIVEGNRALVTAASAHVGLPAIQGSVRQLPLPSASAEVVTLLDVIEHLDRPATALREAVRVLSPGGRLVVNVPAHPRLWSRADVELGHRRRYTRSTLRSELVAAGFEPVVLTHVFSWLVPPVWLLRRVARPSTAELGLDQRSPILDVAALVLTALERQLIGRVSLPFGTSILCVARPAAQPIQ